MENESNGSKKMNVEELDSTRGEGGNYGKGKERGGEGYIERKRFWQEGRVMD